MPDVLIRLRWVQKGKHIHCRLFTAQSRGNYAKCGTLVFDEREWPQVQGAFSRVAEVLPEEDP